VVPKEENPEQKQASDSHGQHQQWVEKYRPRTLNQVRGNDKAIASIRTWAKSWEAGVPKKKGLILSGSHGTGKTSAAYALAQEFNWGVIELNASDARNTENIRRVALAGSVNETFTAAGEFVSVHSGGRKLIIIDEADNMFERISRRPNVDKGEKDMSDRGGRSAIIETLRKTRQPVILIVNDLYELTRDSGAAIKNMSEVVKFQKIRQATVRMVLKSICERENVEITTDALDELSRHADGDLRSAVNDLQLLAQGRDKITFDDLGAIGFRNVKTSIFDALRVILHTTQFDQARKAAWDLDESPEDLILWLDENLPLEYRRPADLMNGYRVLSKADVYLGRIRRRQYYGLWGYAKDLMTSGLALAKKERYHGWVKYQFPSWLMKMSRSKQIRQIQRGIAQKIGHHCHTSRNVVFQDIMPYFRHIYRMNHGFAVAMSIDLEFSKEELGWLLGEKVSSNKVKYLMTEINNTLDRLEKAGGKKKDNSVAIFPHNKKGEVVVTDEEKDEEKDEENADGSEPEHEDGSKEDTSNQTDVDDVDDVDEKDNEKEKKVQKNLFDY
jgi:replication factor C large subunit